MIEISYLMFVSMWVGIGILVLLCITALGFWFASDDRVYNLEILSRNLRLEHSNLYNNKLEADTENKDLTDKLILMTNEVEDLKKQLKAANRNEDLIKKLEVKAKEITDLQYHLGNTTNSLYAIRAKVRSFLGPARASLDSLENSLTAK